uniref:Uncharacterized protein n=1 Tax=Oryza barthii TaxID=65489 RepID=A0A0D3HN90_9ORYZ
MAVWVAGRRAAFLPFPPSADDRGREDANGPRRHHTATYTREFFLQAKDKDIIDYFQNIKRRKVEKDMDGLDPLRKADFLFISETDVY